jgi:hypothetical protein
MDSMVKHPRTRKEAAYVLALGGELCGAATGVWRAGAAACALPSGKHTRRQRACTQPAW